MKHLLQQAIDALKTRQNVFEVISALKEALAKDEQAPFAYFQRNRGWNCWEQVISAAAGQEHVIAAYTRPAQRQPLSEEEIIEIAKSTRSVEDSNFLPILFARTIENAVYEKLGIK